MAKLVAQNGLRFTVEIIYTIVFSYGDYELFHKIFGNLVTFTTRSLEDAVVVQFVLNADEELSKYGSFKDVPTRSVIQKYLPFINESKAFFNSDIGYLKRIMEGYVEKEVSAGRKVSLEFVSLLRDVEEAIDNPIIKVHNLVLGDYEKKTLASS